MYAIHRFTSLVESKMMMMMMKKKNSLHYKEQKENNRKICTDENGKMFEIKKT